jgi:hypothetical protein
MVFSFISFLCAHLKYKLKNTGDVDMHISPISYRSNPQNQHTFTGLNLKKGLLYATMGFASLGITTSKVAAQVSAAVKPIAHAVDSVAIGNGMGLKLYIAGSDSATFNRIFGYLYEPLEKYSGKTKKAVEVFMFEPDKNSVSLVIRGENGNGFCWTPIPKIEAYLKGNGKNQAGQTVSMANDCNIKIVRTYKHIVDGS